MGQRIADIRSASGTGALAADIERQFQAFIEREPEWPLLYYEFWAYGARHPELREAFTDRRRSVQAALAAAVRARADELGVDLPVPVEQIAIGINALMNGLAFERLDDENAVPDGLAGLLISRFLAGVVTGEARAHRPVAGAPTRRRRGAT